MSAFIKRLPIHSEYVAFLILVIGLAWYPRNASLFGILNVTYFIALSFLSLSVALIWGYAGILSFGHTAFFGLGGYLYAVYVVNKLPEGGHQTWIAILVAIIAGIIFAAILGYIMFYGGVNDVFVGLTMLAVTLVMATFMGQTAGPEWAIGKARLNGYNGMSVPQIVWPSGKFMKVEQTYYLYLILLVVVFIVLTLLVSSRWGYALIALRENRDRTETFGYNVRMLQVQVFAISGGVAALSGVLYASWGGYIDPSSMGLTAAITPVIYVAIGGRKSLAAAIIASMALMKFSQMLSSNAPEYAFVILGTVALLAVLFVSEGIVFTLFSLADRYIFRRFILRSAKSGNNAGLETGGDDE